MFTQPIFLGIVGDSAAGKTTLAAGLATILGPSRVACLCTDDYHRYSRAERAARHSTALHPDSNDIDLLEEHIGQLEAGRPIVKPVYNHVTGAHDAPQLLAPAPVVIVEGLLGFATPRLRERYQLKIFLDPLEDLRRSWKILRDTASRGYSAAQVEATLARCSADAAEFIRPQRSWADMVISFGLPAERPEDNSNQLNARLVLRPSLSCPDFTDLIAYQSDGPPALHLRVGRDNGRLTEILEIDGSAGAAVVQKVIHSHMSALPHLHSTRIGKYMYGGAPRLSPSLALVQLLIAYQLMKTSDIARSVYENSLMEYLLPTSPAKGNP